MRTSVRGALLALFLGAGAVQPAQGQVLIGLLFGDKVSSERFHLEFNIGGNFANLSGIEGTKLKPGFMLALGGEWRFAGDFMLQPELMPFYFTGAKNLPTDAFIGGSGPTAENAGLPLHFAYALPESRRTQRDLTLYF